MKDLKEKLINRDPANIQANIKMVKKEAGISSSNKIKSKTRVKRKIDVDSTTNLPRKLKPILTMC